MKRDTVITTEAPFDIIELDLNGLDCRGLGRVRLVLEENYRDFHCCYHRNSYRGGIAALRTMPEAGNWFFQRFGIEFGDTVSYSIWWTVTIFILSKKNSSTWFQQCCGKEDPVKSIWAHQTAPKGPQLECSDVEHSNLETWIKRQLQKRVMRSDQQPRNLYLRRLKAMGLTNIYIYIKNIYKLLLRKSGIIFPTHQARSKSTDSILENCFLLSQ